MSELPESLIASPLYGELDGSVLRNGASLRGITKKLHARYGGGHLVKRLGRSNVELGLRVHCELREWVIRPGTRRSCTLHPWTRQALEVLAAHHMRPIGAEVAIAHGKLGTRVDIIARHPLRAGCSLISIKTGLRRGPDRGPRLKLPPPFSDIKRCEQTLDALQIAAERGLARKGHAVLFDSAHVIEVPEGAFREAPPWTSNPNLQDALLIDLEK